MVGESYATENIPSIIINCDVIDWNDVEDLVEPYMSELLHNALIGQALSSEYQVSEAASQALIMDKPHPEIITRILQSIAQCPITSNTVVK